jgi:hypothetical protein
MSRLSVTLNVVLMAAVLTQAWMLIGRGKPEQDRLIVQSDAAIAPLSARVSESDPMNAISSRLAAIDARLASLERATPIAAGQARERASQTRITPQAAAIADRKFASMFPDAEFDRDDMIRFQAALAALPIDEKAELGTAFSRAVNAGRIKLLM